ncbi:uncharacterized protein LOC142768623 isoform X2 [Rhipicephalus microplus]|uniref:uncharacterized protein LOC142768623 isoform X2 n=1 Tax=Rhipicephalus microplus TaxID=6941 RepID=UPI003F6D93BB
MYALHGVLMTVAMPLFCDITALVKVSVAENTVPPIVNVFNTSQPLWFYQRNSSDPEPRDTCISYGFIAINETDYYSWNNVSYTKTFNISERCHGIFEKCTGENLGAIEITCTDETDYISGPHDSMELMYTEPNCSVFFTYSLEGIRASTEAAFTDRTIAYQELPKNDARSP